MKKLIVSCAALLFVLTVAVPASAELQLRTIMKEMGDRVEKITHGINTGDFELIEKNALLIAEHEKPPMIERMKILSFLKSESSNFKSSDAKVHDEAVKLAEAAKKKDYDAILLSFADVMKGCVNCHSNYRQKIVDHFYEDNK